MKKKLLHIALVIFIIASFHFFIIKNVSAAGNTCTWTGSGGDMLFSTATNWSGCSGVPTNGDNLIFNDVSDPDNTYWIVDNDITGLTVANITFSGSISNYAGTIINGNEITISSGIHVSQTDSYVMINAPLKLGGNVTVTGSEALRTRGGINLNGHTLVNNNFELGLDSIVTGNGNVVVNQKTSFGAGWSGDIDTWMGNLSVASGAIAYIYPTSLGSNNTTVTVADGGSLFIEYTGKATITQDIIIGGSGASGHNITTDGSEGALIMEGYAEGGSEMLTLAGKITLTSNTEINSLRDVSINGSLLGAHTISMLLTGFYNIENPYALIICSSNNQSLTSNNCTNQPPNSNSHDTGFRPSKDGFGFQNYGIPTLSWSSFEQLFGKLNVTASNNKHLAAAQGYYDKYYETAAKKGRCSGITGASIINFSKLDQDAVGPFMILGRNGYFDVKTDTYYNEIGLPQYDLQKSTGYFQGVFTGKTIDDWFIDHYNNTAQENLNDIKSYINNGEPPSVSLWGISRDENLYGDEVGHTLAAYKYVEHSDTTDVYVYDSNYPGNNDRKIVFNTSNNSWFYKGDLLTTYSSEFVNGEMLVIPGQLYTQNSEPMWETDKKSTIVASSTLHSTLVTNDNKTTGIVDGKLLEEVEGAYMWPNFGQTEPAISVTTFKTSLGRNYNIKMTKILDGQDSLDIFGNNAYISINGLTPTINDKAQIILGENGKSVELSTAKNLADYSISLDQEGNRISHVFTITGTSIALDEKITYELLNIDGKLKISNNGSDKQYNIVLQEVGDGNSEITLKNITLNGSMTQIWTPSSWDDLIGKAIIVEVDKNSDGIIDSTTIANAITINDGEEYTNSKAVLLHLIPPPNQSQTRIFNDPFQKNDKKPQWQTFNPDLEWNLSGGNGKKTVYVQFKSNSGETSDIYNASIIFDNKKPIVRDIDINNGQVSTNNPNVHIIINSKDKLSGVQSMRVSNDKDISIASWQAYNKEFDWTLESLKNSTPERRTVYIQLKDNANNVSRVFNDSILLKP